jgi:hypothetical protein
MLKKAYEHAMGASKNSGLSSVLGAINA